MTPHATPSTPSTVGAAGRRSSSAPAGRPDTGTVVGRSTVEPGGSARTRPSLRRGSSLTGGVAPMVAPPGRWARLRARRRWGRRGFVPLSPGRPKRRHRILPRTVIGISTMLLAFAVGIGFSGAAFYAYYDHRLARNEEEVARFVEGFDQQFTSAADALEQVRVDSIQEIRDELGPLGDYRDDAEGVIGLPPVVGPSVWRVETRDQAGRVVTGAAFAVTGHGGGAALVTDLEVVRASTAAPGPGITLTKGDRRVPAELWAWDEEFGLALVVTAEPIPVLPLASPAERREALGGRVFAVSGQGGQGATASPGLLIDNSSAGLQHTAVVGAFFEGGPLVDGKGRVVGIATTRYRPFGVDAAPVLASPSVDNLCRRILVCADSTADSVAVEITADDGSAPGALGD